jgi:hypothetical protein
MSGSRRVASPHFSEFSISKKAVSLLAKIGAEVVLTVYAPLKDEVEGEAPAPSQLSRPKKRKITRKTGLANRRKRSR